MSVKYTSKQTSEYVYALECAVYVFRLFIAFITIGGVREKIETELEVHP